MNKLSKRLVPIVTLISIAASSLASERIAIESANSIRQVKSAVPILLSKKTAFDATDFAKYRMMEQASTASLSREAAGASHTQTTVITVIVVVAVVAGIALLVWTHGGEGVPVGNVGNAFLK